MVLERDSQPGRNDLFLESPFASWMDRFHVERPGMLVPAESPPLGNAAAALVAKMGIAHEERELAALRAAGRDVWEPPSRRVAFEATIEAMRAGRDVIYQAALRRDDFEGHADFLIRVEEPSALGTFSYEVSDTKLARRPKPYFLLQLCAYAAMIETVQGRRPAFVHVVTGDSLAHSFRTEDYHHYFRSLERAFLDAQAAFHPERPPVPEPRAEHRRWAKHAEDVLEQLDHPSRVATMTSVQVRRLADAGIVTMKALATSSATHIPRLEDRVFDRLRRQARLQIESAGLERPRYELTVLDEKESRRGLATLPPASTGDVFFDMEGYPFAEGGLEYLFGATYVERGQRLFFETWAHDGPAARAGARAEGRRKRERAELDAQTRDAQGDRALRKALPAGVRVGSVDKFQGQEAPVAIVSMCASSGDCVARGPEFLLSVNRLNVALSRAQSLAIVVGSPQLAHARVTTVEQMRLVNFFCRVRG